MLRPQLSPERIPDADIRFLPLETGDAIFMANGFQPISQETIHVGESTETVDVVAVLRSRDREGRDLELFLTKPIVDPEADSTAPLTIHSIQRTDRGIVSMRSDIQDQNQPFFIQTGSLKFNYVPSDPTHRGWASIRASAVGRSWSFLPTLTLAEASHPVRVSPHDRQENKRLNRKFKVLAAVAIYFALTQPGGVIDRVTDGSHSAKAYIEQKFGTIAEQEAALHQAGSDVDGIHESHDELVQDVRAEAGQHYAAVNRVARTFEDIDEHRFDRVRQRSAEFVAARPDVSEVVPPEQRQIFKDRLDKSANAPEALKIINEFMGLYGSNAYIGDDLSPDHIATESFHHKLVYTSGQVIDGIGQLPKILVHRVLKRNPEASVGGGIVFDFGTKDQLEVQGTGGGKATAYWDSTTNRMVLQASDVVNLGFVYLHLPEFLGSLRLGVLHEFTHGMDDDVLAKPGSSYIKNPSQDTKYDSILSLVTLKNIGSKLISRPHFVSAYAATDPEENAAEAGSEVLAGQIEDPDHVGEFESRANLAKLAILIRLETRYPGISDFLITQLSPDLLSE